MTSESGEAAGGHAGSAAGHAVPAFPEVGANGDDPDGTGGSDAEIIRDRRRAELIAAAQARWVATLTDLGGRNTLLYYKDRRAGTLAHSPVPRC